MMPFEFVCEECFELCTSGYEIRDPPVCMTCRWMRRYANDEKKAYLRKILNPPPFEQDLPRPVRRLPRFLWDRTPKPDDLKLLPLAFWLAMAAAAALDDFDFIPAVEAAAPLSAICHYQPAQAPPDRSRPCEPPSSRS
jgi:hypothetical protein